MLKKMLATIGKACRKVCIALIKIYQIVLSPLLGPRCRFYPSCSSYSIEAIEKHGVVRGAFYMFKRILRCHPFSAGGLDPVPAVKSKRITHGL